jgi:hypothetical protein
MEHLLQCGICYTEYDEKIITPRQLPCQHSICSLCLSQMLKNTNTDEELEVHIECPFCKRTFNNMKIEEIPKSLVILQLIDATKGMVSNQSNSSTNIDIKVSSKNKEISQDVEPSLNQTNETNELKASNLILNNSNLSCSNTNSSFQDHDGTIILQLIDSTKKMSLQPSNLIASSSNCSTITTNSSNKLSLNFTSLVTPKFSRLKSAIIHRFKPKKKNLSSSQSPPLYNSQPKNSNLDSFSIKSNKLVNNIRTIDQLSIINESTSEDDNYFSGLDGTLPLTSNFIRPLNPPWDELEDTSLASPKSAIIPRIKTSYINDETIEQTEQNSTWNDRSYLREIFDDLVWNHGYQMSYNQLCEALKKSSAMFGFDPVVLEILMSENKTNKEDIITFDKFCDIFKNLNVQFNQLLDMEKANEPKF